ncbi:MAG TPA: hypothetical protein P5534_22270 [Candidatus Paceibacterota bacterium]|nr:hypothetical protein [Candidatus Paceibacterota bacterium]
MPRSSDPEKLGLWRVRFRRFSSSGLPVEQFCARERVSVASFYYWRKKLEPRSDAGAEGRQRQVLDPRVSTRAGVFRPVTVVPAMSGVWIHLPGGTRIEVRAEHPEAVHAVIGEVVRLDRGVRVGGVDGGSPTS